MDYKLWGGGARRTWNGLGESKSALGGNRSCEEDRV